MQIWQKMGWRHKKILCDGNIRCNDYFQFHRMKYPKRSAPAEDPGMCIGYYKRLFCIKGFDISNWWWIEYIQRIGRYHTEIGSQAILVWYTIRHYGHCICSYILSLSFGMPKYSWSWSYSWCCSCLISLVLGLGLAQIRQVFF